MKADTIDVASAESIRVVIADDHPVTRHGLKILIDTAEGLEVVGEAGSGRGAVEEAKRSDPDVVVIDLRMPEMDGIEATRRILARTTKAHVLVLTNYGTDHMLFPALEAGALGFLLKDVTGPELVRAIRRVAQGLSSLSPSIARRLVREVSHDRPHARGAQLTPRENEVLRVMADGGSNDEIADALCISSGTVRTHVTHILSKLSLTRRAQAVAYAIKHRMADIDDA